MRVYDDAPFGRWQTSTRLAALRVAGLTAPGVFDGAIDGPGFLAYVEQILVPTLRPGDRVIADNVSAHNVAGVRRAIEQAGATLLAVTRRVSPAVQSRRMPELLPPCRVLGRWATMETALARSGQQQRKPDHHEPAHNQPGHECAGGACGEIITARCRCQGLVDSRERPAYARLCRERQRQRDEQ